MSAVQDVSDIERITRRRDAGPVALAAYDQLLALLVDLSEEDWSADTECAGWRIRDMVGHLIGAAGANASMRENLRQQAWGYRHRRRYGGNALDAVNARQISEHAGLDPARCLLALREQAPAAVRGRMHTPAPIRAVTVPLDAGGSTASGMPRSVNLGHLADVIYTRDVWMHTVDIARAAGRPFVPIDPVNRRLVADVVAEWAARHARPVDLVLTGPAGGHYHSGGSRGSSGGRAFRPAERVELELDAIEFCRVLSGRAAGAGLLATRILF